MGAREVLPRVFLCRLQRQGHTLAIHVDVEHLDRDLLADFDNLGRVVDVLPGKLGHMHETVNATEINESAEVDNRRHDAVADLALLELGEEGLANRALGLLEPRATREHDVVAVLIELDDLRLKGFTHVGKQITHATHLHKRCRQEATQADVDDETALDDLDDLTLDDAVLLLDALDGAPCALVLSTLLGQD